MLQLTTQNDLETTEQKYFDVIRGKTAALFAAACEVGGVIAGRAGSRMRGTGAIRHGSRHGLPAGGRCAGLLRRSGELGKTVGDDFREGKLTYPVLLAIADAEGEEAAFWTRTIGEGRAEGTDLADGAGR